MFAVSGEVSIATTFPTSTIDGWNAVQEDQVLENLNERNVTSGQKKNNKKNKSIAVISLNFNANECPSASFFFLFLSRSFYSKCRSIEPVIECQEFMNHQHSPSVYTLNLGEETHDGQFKTNATLHDSQVNNDTVIKTLARPQVIPGMAEETNVQTAFWFSQHRGCSNNLRGCRIRFSQIIRLYLHFVLIAAQLNEQNETLVGTHRTRFFSGH